MFGVMTYHFMPWMLVSSQKKQSQLWTNVLTRLVSSVTSHILQKKIVFM
jgi:hypothetical protein